MKIHKLFFAIPFALASTIFTTHALASEELARKNGCFGCHAVNQKIVGPSLQEVALKYKSQPDAAKKLAESLVKGSTGKWGTLPMPPQPQLSPGDALALASWVLATR